MKREPHVRFCEGLGCNSLGLLTYGHSHLAREDLGINNAPDERPPFVNQYEMPTGSVGSGALGYDQANASLLGWQISLQAVKHWGQ